MTDDVWTTNDPDALRISSPNGRLYEIPGMPEPVRSVTSIKPPFQGKGKTPLGGRVPLDVLRAAEAVAATPDRWGELDPDLIVEEIAQAPSVWLAQAGQRGNDVHDRIERHILGAPIDPDQEPDEIRPFLDAFKAWETDYRPRWIATEVVAVLRSYGLAGTIDAIAELAGKVVLIDWKSRGGRHGAYAEEAAQLGLYSLAEWLLIGDGAQTPMPTVDGLAVVSLALDGTYQMFSLDLDAARDAGLNMLAAHQAVEDMREAGQIAVRGTKPPAPAPAPAPTSADTGAVAPTMHQQRVAWVQTRVRDLPPPAREDLLKRWPTGVPRKAADLATGEQITRLATVLSTVEADHRLPFGDPDPEWVAKQVKPNRAKPATRDPFTKPPARGNTKQKGTK